MRTLMLNEKIQQQQEQQQYIPKEKKSFFRSFSFQCFVVAAYLTAYLIFSHSKS